MSREEKIIHEKIANAISNCVPDVLDNILARCGEKEGAVIKMAMKKSTKRSWIKMAVAIAAALVVVIGGAFAVNAFSHGEILDSIIAEVNQVDSVVFLDVNPSIEFEVNVEEKIIKVNALNDDAKAVLDGMNFEGLSLEEGMNAVIDALIEHGYISESANSVLVTVKNDDTKKCVELQERLLTKVNEMLQAKSVDGAVVAQVVSKIGSLKALAKQYNISLGRAQFIQRIIDADSTLTFEELAGLPMSKLSLLAEAKNASTDDAISSGEVNEDDYIGKSAARDLALNAAGVNVEDVQSISIDFDLKDGTMVYEVKFTAGGFEYKYMVDAKTGDILEDEKEAADTDEDEDLYIGKGQAKKIALANAGLKPSSVQRLTVEFQYNNGSPYYEVQFETDQMRYEYRIEAENGNIIHTSTEVQSGSTGGSDNGTKSGSGGKKNQ